MNKIPVLLLISKEISLRTLNDSPRFSSYRFYSLSAMQHLERPASKAARPALHHVLGRKISRIKPQYLVTHLGLAFERYPVDFLNAVLDVKLLHPEIKIGTDRSLEYAIQHLQAFHETNPEISSLIDRLVQNRSVFDLDDQTVFFGRLFVLKETACLSRLSL